MYIMGMEKTNKQTNDPSSSRQDWSSLRKIVHLTIQLSNESCLLVLKQGEWPFEIIKGFLCVFGVLLF